MSWGFRTCINKNGKTRLAWAVSADGVDCEVVASPTRCPREEAEEIRRHAVLDLSLKSKKKKHYPPNIFYALVNLSAYDGNILVKSMWSHVSWLGMNHLSICPYYCI